MNRRTFLALSALSATGFAAWTLISTQPQKGRGRLSMTYETPSGNGIAMMDLDTRAFATFATPFNIHYVETSKCLPNFAVGANKYGRNFAEFDLAKGVVTRAHQVDEDLSLMGHMALSNDGKFLCATATDKLNRNLILKIDPNDFHIIKRIIIGVANPAPHDLRFLQGSRTLLTTSANELTYINFSNGEITRHKVEDLTTGSAIRHFGVSPDGRVAVQANQIAGLDKPVWKYGHAEVVTASHNSSSKPDLVRTFRPPKEYAGEFEKEMLDFAFSADASIFGATMNHQPLVTFWDFKTGNMIGAVNVEGANRIGLTFDHEHFVVFTRYGVRYISATTLKHIPELDQFDDDFAKLFPESVSPVFGHKTLREPA